MLIPIKYHTRNYPDHIETNIDEIAGHFDVSSISNTSSFSLHTEYSYGKRKLNSDLLKTFPTLKSAHKKGVPQLWYSEQWAKEFANFIKLLCNGKSPTIIEIHPPFSDYIKSVDEFLYIYSYFEEYILTDFPKTNILLENRSGSIYEGGKFIISKGRHLRSLCKSISEKIFKLRIALDIPQLLTEYGGPQKLDSSKLENILNRQNVLQPYIDSIHLWGKKKSNFGKTVSHAGDLNTYFGNEEKKDCFLKWLSKFLNDGRVRYFVPEVNSCDKDLHEIINDLEKYDIKFQSSHVVEKNDRRL